MLLRRDVDRLVHRPELAHVRHLDAQVVLVVERAHLDAERGPPAAARSCTCALSPCWEALSNSTAVGRRTSTVAGAFTMNGRLAAHADAHDAASGTYVTPTLALGAKMGPTLSWLYAS